MAGSKSTYLENAILNHVLGRTIYTPPSALYVALSSALYNESATTSFSELSGAGYARAAVSNDGTAWPSSGSTSSKANGVTITFPAATGGWAEVKSFYILDAASGGNILYGGDLVTPRTLLAGDTAAFGPGSITITED